jgi:hypothetical protein
MQILRSHRMCGQIILSVVLFLLVSMQVARAQAQPCQLQLPLSCSWSGYMLTAGNYTSAQATWTVPRISFVNYQNTISFQSQAAWVGIGSKPKDLIQIGVNADVENTGATGYFAWYDLLPDTLVPLTMCNPDPNCTVVAGDVITASVVCVLAAGATPCSGSPNVPQTWQLSMTNVGQGGKRKWSWTNVLPYVSSLSTVEWIVEGVTSDPSNPNTASPLPYYSPESFWGLLSNGINPNLSPSSSITMIDPNGGTSTPCPSIFGNQFIVAYGTSCPPPQQGPSLLGTGSVGTEVDQGYSVGLSADGNTAIVGAPYDNSGVGAAWVFTRAGGVWSQAKLAGTGYSSSSSVNQGSSVALSADGNTAILGGPGNDYGYPGAAWVFAQSGGVWTQQAMLVGTGYGSTPTTQGNSVTLSGDGNTAIVGGRGDNNYQGAAWVFTRSGGVWTQEGSKLVGTSGYEIWFGSSVSLSADGNTAIVGATGDNSGNGAAFIFTQSGGVWTQQGPKLIGNDVVGPYADFGGSVALSADGNTAVMGGFGDNNAVGAMWIFTRSGGAWTQQGSKLVGSGLNISDAGGKSVAISGDGYTAIMGSEESQGAWIFNQTGGVWTQQTQIAGNPANDNWLGYSVALSGDGSTAILGSPYTNGSIVSIGSASIYVQLPAVTAIAPASGLQAGGTNITLIGTDFVGATAINFGLTPASSFSVNSDMSISATAPPGYGTVGVTVTNANGTSIVSGANFFTYESSVHDFNGDGKSDIVWRDTGGNVAVWLMNGAGVTTPAGIGNVPTTWNIVGQRDFNGDGNADLLWLDTSGNMAMWFMNGAASGSAEVVGNIPTNWSVAGVADFNGDGLGDILWRDTAGDYAVWLMNGAMVTSSVVLGNLSPTTWSVVGTGDFNGDGMADILWRDTGGDIAIWFMNGTTVASTAFVGTVANWSVVGIGDFNGDGKSDIVWRDTAGDAAIWLMNGAAAASTGGLGNIGTMWSIALVGDYNGDGMSDLLWRDTSGNTAMWFMNGVAVSSTGVVGNISTVWTVQSVNAE